MLFFVLILIGVYVFVQGVFSFYSLKKSDELLKKTFTRKMTFGDSKKPLFKLFVGGDSVAVGIGASSFETSVAGRIANYFSKEHFVQFESGAKVGAKMRDILSMPKPGGKQDLIILIVSSNDLFRFSNVAEFSKSASEVVDEYSKLTDKLIIVGPGRIFDTTATPVVMHPIYRLRGDLYANAIDAAISSKKNVVHIDPTKADKAMVDSYGNILASDHFHPNDQGHKFWFDLIAEKF